MKSPDAGQALDVTVPRGMQRPAECRQNPIYHLTAARQGKIFGDYKAEGCRAAWSW